MPKCSRRYWLQRQRCTVVKIQTVVAESITILPSLPNRYYRLVVDCVSREAKEIDRLLVHLFVSALSIQPTFELVFCVCVGRDCAYSCLESKVRVIGQGQGLGLVLGISSKP